ncbi:MAG: deoxyribose-phosphate aldolase [Nitrososphaerota archaeon]
MSKYSVEQLASKIQHTNVAPEATVKDIEKLCRECVEYGFNAAVVNPIWVSHALRLLKGSGVKVSAALNFPIGASTTLSKVVEIRNLAAYGCDELDFMINLGYLKSGMLEEFRRDVEMVVEAAEGMVVKAILETAVLTEEELGTAARICEEAGVHYIKNSSGWGRGGPATVEIIKLMRSLVSPKVGIKASGGIRDRTTAEALLDAGADLLGTSRGVQIVTGGAVSSEVTY